MVGGEKTFKKNYWLLSEQILPDQKVSFLFKNNKDKYILRKVQFDEMGVEINLVEDIGEEKLWHGRRTDSG